MASLGTPDCKSVSPKLLQYVRTALCHGFHIKKDYEKKGQLRFDYILWETLLEHAQDPDVVVSEWLPDVCPTGIGESIIEANDIFPATSGPSSAILAAQDFARLRDLKGWHCEDHRNNASFYTDLLKDQGFIETFTEWKQVTERWPNAVASKVAVFLKTREDGNNQGTSRSSMSGVREATAASNCPSVVCDSETVEVSTWRRYRLRLVGRRLRRCFSHVGDSRAGPWCHGPFVPTKAGSFRRLCCGMAAARGWYGVAVSAAAARLGQTWFSCERVTDANLCRRPGNRHK